MSKSASCRALASAMLPITPIDCGVNESLEFCISGGTWAETAWAQIRWVKARRIAVLIVSSPVHWSDSHLTTWTLPRAKARGEIESRNGLRLASNGGRIAAPDIPRAWIPRKAVSKSSGGTWEVKNRQSNSASRASLVITNCVGLPPTGLPRQATRGCSTRSKLMPSSRS